jgi:hypothetical protein
MPTPKELRALTNQGKADRAKQEELRRKEEERKAREARMEKAVKEQAEAQQYIANVEASMERTAKDGGESIRLNEVHTQDPLRLEGVPRIVYFYFQKKDFRVEIEQVDGPDIRQGPDYRYFIKVSW